MNIDILIVLEPIANSVFIGLVWSCKTLNSRGGLREMIQFDATTVMQLYCHFIVLVLSCKTLNSGEICSAIGSKTIRMSIFKRADLYRNPNINTEIM